MPPSSELITKRLHISGLTPAITKEDLQKRLSSFGTVKSLDGFGLPDGLGQPRRFGYITIEATAPQLSKCLNILSGSTWKGTKLRLGDAKPDFRERLERERAQAAAEPPRKRRRRDVGITAEDMSLVTPENAAQRPGWKVTQLGRIVRPMRMRPGKPLPRPLDAAKVPAGKVKPGEDQQKIKRRVRIKPPLVRARRRLIDPTQWDSVHLKGVFLDNASRGPSHRIDLGTQDVLGGESSEASSSSEDTDDDDGPSSMPAVSRAAPSEKGSLATVPATPAPAAQPNNADLKVVDTDAQLAEEKLRALTVLDSLFGGKDDADWIGQESVDSDIDEADLNKKSYRIVDTDVDFEEVPMETDPTPSLQFSPAKIKTPPRISAPAIEPDAAMHHVEPPSQAPLKAHQETKLKDLFAPREEEAAFSLLGHLDLDLELDDEVPFPINEKLMGNVHVPPSAPIQAQLSQSVHTALRHTSATLDPKKPLFFPPRASFPFGQSKPSQLRGRARDAFDVARERGWAWRDPDVAFWRTDTEDTIRKRWEEQKVELTRDWKRRWREAGKVRRRRGAGTADDI